MVNKISRLQRWLDRLGAACDSKHWDAAVVEADCLSAEVREVREELWKLAMEEPSAAGRIFSREGMAMSFKSVVIAMLIVMFSTLPIAVESEKPWSQAGSVAQKELPSAHLSWVTNDEDELLQVLRAGLNAGNPSANMALNPAFAAAPPALKKNAARNTAVQKTAVQTPGVRAAITAKPLGKTEASLTQEDMLALIQVGEKALRGGEPAIKVMR